MTETPRLQKHEIDYSFMYTLKEGDRLVRRDRGTVEITDIAKLGHGRLKLTYKTMSGETDVYETWSGTHARILRQR